MSRETSSNIRDRVRSFAFGRNIRRVRKDLDSTDFLHAGQERSRIYRSSTIVLDCRIEDLRVAFDIAVGPLRAKLSVVGRDDIARKILRNAFIGAGLNVRTNGERIVLGVWQLWPRRNRAMKGLIGKVSDAIDRISSLPTETHPDRQIQSTHALTYWWDTKANFGDTIGPWLVTAITGLRPVNSRWVTNDGPTLFTVGSVIGHLETPGNHIWGSGLIGRPGPAKLAQLKSAQPARIHAVRGKHTREILIGELGWVVPEVYGDPALLLPRYYDPSPSKAVGKIALVPHYKHKQEFAALSGSGTLVVDVAEGLERVVDQIAGATAVISTSMHGLIIAQAYGIPWVWMRVTDKQLGGDTFKFEDFFSLLDRSEVASLDVCAHEIDAMDVKRVAVQARLPKSFYNLDLLEKSFPTQLFDLPG